MKKIVSLLVAIIVAVTVTFGTRWYAYIHNTESPYDEIGIELHSRMPMPIRKWGCDKLHATFANAIPPYGCQKPEDMGRSWL
ncbi:hypothetical protein ACQKKX_12360 [Neorhizobium sp. NPDC001467]|uniref:hypothetical protein n=1 Tax=Neorhizobium sp. NPDC001467 TaxID=3390595 RepID=UPI003D0615DD